MTTDPTITPEPQPATDLPARLEAALTKRFTELGNPFSRMRINFQGPDGWPASKEVGPHDVAEVLRELLSTEEPPAALPPVSRAAVLREAARIVRGMDSDYAVQEAAEHLDGLAVEDDEEREAQANLAALADELPRMAAEEQPAYDRTAWETYRRDVGCACTSPDPATCAVSHRSGPWLCVCHRLSAELTAEERATLFPQEQPEPVSPAYTRLKTAVTKANAEAATHAMRGMKRVFQLARRYGTGAIPAAEVLAALGLDENAGTVEAGGEEQPSKPAPDVSPTAALLATRCDTCLHTLNRHTNYAGCTVVLCVCGRFQPPVDDEAAPAAAAAPAGTEEER